MIYRLTRIKTVCTKHYPHIHLTYVHGTYTIATIKQNFIACKTKKYANNTTGNTCNRVCRTRSGMYPGLVDRNEQR